MSSSGRLTEFLWKMWDDYTALTLAAKTIHDGFVARGEKLVNDHIALRTIRHPRLGIDQLASPFERLGYRRVRDYAFKEKKLHAWHFENEDEAQPKVFISELLLEEFSPFCQATLNRLIATIPEAHLSRDDFTTLGRPWTLSADEYLKLADESEYASWVAAYGFRPNHFTILVNPLKTFSGLPAVNTFVKSLGFRLNSAGGEIKGTPGEYLEQSSILAETVPVRFTDKTLQVPGCYYEFAQRYPLPSGKLYQGFVASSADKIFESTHRSQ